MPTSRTLLCILLRRAALPSPHYYIHTYHTKKDAKIRCGPKSSGSSSSTPPSQSSRSRRGRFRLCPVCLHHARYVSCGANVVLSAFVIHEKNEWKHVETLQNLSFDVMLPLPLGFELCHSRTWYDVPSLLALTKACVVIRTCMIYFAGSNLRPVYSRKLLMNGDVCTCSLVVLG